MKNDIETRADIDDLMNRFYAKAISDDTIGYIFTDVAKIDIEAHLPILVDFLDMVLFQSDTYQKNALQLHMHLHRQSPFKAEHFTTWLHYFNQTVDENFEGDIALLAKQRAKSIATIMQIKMPQTK